MTPFMTGLKATVTNWNYRDKDRANAPKALPYAICFLTRHMWLFCGDLVSYRFLFQPPLFSSVMRLFMQFPTARTTTAADSLSFARDITECCHYFAPQSTQTTPTFRHFTVTFLRDTLRLQGRSIRSELTEIAHLLNTNLLHTNLTS
jgi:hypothetical protein